MAFAARSHVAELDAHNCEFADKLAVLLARPERFELPAPRFEV